MTAPAALKSKAHSDFFLPSLRSGQHETCNIGTRDQKHRATIPAAKVKNCVLVCLALESQELIRANGRFPVWAFSRIRFACADPLGQCIQLRLCLRRGNSGLEPADNCERKQMIGD